MTLKNTGLNGYNYDFSVGYAIEVADILEIHMYLTGKRQYKMFEFVNNMFISAMMLFVVIYQI